MILLHSQQEFTGLQVRTKLLMSKFHRICDYIHVHVCHYMYTHVHVYICTKVLPHTCTGTCTLYIHTCYCLCALCTGEVYNVM